MSLISRDEIQKLHLILEDEVPGGYRDASYDIRIGRVIAQVPVGVAELDSHVLKPQGIAEVISQEIVKLPPEILGYASIKTGLSRQGILALNTGIIDPGYEGPLSATVVNFGDTKFLLNRGEVFLRLTFHRFVPAEHPILPRSWTRDEFLQGRKKEVAAQLSASFLNIPALVEEIASKYLGTYIRQLLGAAAAVALVVTLLAFSVTLGVSYFQPYSMSKDKIRGELGTYFRDDQFDSYQKQLAELEKNVKELKAEQAQNAGGESSRPQPEEPSEPRRQMEHK
jgi:deoxycytidine triphosphate deaminase